jgi:hypothetical protein
MRQEVKECMEFEVNGRESITFFVVISRLPSRYSEKFSYTFVVICRLSSMCW